MTVDARTRFLRKIRFTDFCWEWIGAHTRTGYGNFAVDSTRAAKRFTPAHRYAYELLVGPIPEGLHLAHLCRNRGCVNPAHLEPVTNQENAQRGARGRLVVVCRHGHPYTEENTIRTNEGRRRCRTCSREQNKRAQAKRAGECADCGVTISHGRQRCRIHAQRHRREEDAMTRSEKGLRKGRPW